MKRKSFLAMFMALTMIGTSTFANFDIINSSIVYASEIANVNEDDERVIDNAISRVLTLVENERFQKDRNDNIAVSCSALGTLMPDSYIKNKIEEIKKIGKYEKATECCKAILAITASGVEATNIQGHNLIEDLSSYQIGEDIYSNLYLLLALNCDDFKLSEDMKLKKEDAIKSLLQSQKENGAWNNFTSDFDCDSTAMVITALAPYYNLKENVKEAIDRGIARIVEMQNEEGELVGRNNKNGSSESLSQVIIALCSLGIDPVICDKFTKNNKNLIELLLSYETKDGGFAHTKQFGLDELNEMATDQAFMALAAYKKLKTNNTALYDIKNLCKFEKNLEEKEGLFINNLTSDKQFKLGGEAKIKIEALNKLKNEKEITLIVSLYNKNTNKIVKYAASSKKLNIDEKENLQVNVKLPKEGNYEVKIFIWDNFNDMNNLAKEIVIPVN